MADAMPLAAFLELAKLSKHLASLEEAGCADAADLAEATDDDLAECGLKKMELKRLRRHLAELGGGGSPVASVVSGSPPPDYAGAPNLENIITEAQIASSEKNSQQAINDTRWAALSEAEQARLLALSLNDGTTRSGFTKGAPAAPLTIT